MLIPTTMTCKTNASAYEATINSLMSDDIEGDGQVTVIASLQCNISQLGMHHIF